jgi:photosystem II stability/assembly factor-like uncharacterized protein
VGQDKILATTDGGRHWIMQDAGKLDLTSVDFISSQVGWAVGLRTVLATTDGGAHWTALPEPCPLIRSVHFVTPDVGFAVAGGGAAIDVNVETPEVGAVVLITSDGGRSWRTLRSPGNAQTVCFTDPRDGWLGAGGRLYRTADAGHSWEQVTAGVKPYSARYPAAMIVQCAGGGSAWALDIGFGAASSQQPHVGYHAGPAGAVPIFAEQYFPHPGAVVRANSPGSYAGPFSAISPSAAAYIDWCPACEPGPSTPWDLATGTALTREGNVRGLSTAQAASFLSTRVGWVVGVMTKFNRGSGNSRQFQRIVFTDDGGRTWHVQYTEPISG